MEIADFADVVELLEKFKLMVKRELNSWKRQDSCPRANSHL